MHPQFRILDLKHLSRATCHSLCALAHAWKHEQSFRHDVLAFPLIALILFLAGKSAAIILLSQAAWCVVVGFELLNSAVEASFDMQTTEFDPRVKTGKDMASASIFAAMIGNLLLWLYWLFVM